MPGLVASLFPVATFDFIYPQNGEIYYEFVFQQSSFVNNIWYIQVQIVKPCQIMAINVLCAATHLRQVAHGILELHSYLYSRIFCSQLIFIQWGNISPVQ